MEAIVIKGLSYSYGKTDVLKDLNLEVKKGVLTAILGPNGSGKSTLLKVISGYLTPWSGHVSVLGQDLKSVTAQERSSLVSFSGDEPEPAFNYSVKETVLMGRIMGKDSFREYQNTLDALDLKDKESRPLGTLSQGERQRAFLARTLYQDAGVLLLDEPVSHLDLSYQLSFMEMVKKIAEKGKKVVLVVLHDVNLAMRYAQRIIFLREGALYYDAPPCQVTPEMVEEIYGVSAEIKEVEGYGRFVLTFPPRGSHSPV